MFERNLAQKVAIILVVAVVALLFLVRVDGDSGLSLNLKPGLDIAGGVSMIYEINDEGLGNDNVAEEMIKLLKQRVDKDGVLDLVWRGVGRNRIEVQMPLPPKRTLQLKEGYSSALEELFEDVVKPSDVERIARLPEDQRRSEAERVAKGVVKDLPKQVDAILTAAQRYDDYRAAIEKLNAAPPADDDAENGAVSQAELDVRDAQELWQDAKDAVLAMNLDRTRFQDTLQMAGGSDIRNASLQELTGIDVKSKRSIDEAIEAVNVDEYPLGRNILEVVQRFDTWRKSKGKLDSAADLQRLLMGAGVLEFRILAEPSPENQAKYASLRRQLAEFGPTKRDGEYGWFKIDNPIGFFSLNSPAELAEYNYLQDPSIVVDKRGNDYYVLAHMSAEKGLLHTKGKSWQLRRAMIGNDNIGRLAVNFELDALGGQRFGELTGRNIGRRLCIMVDDIAYSAPNIEGRITTQGIIRGDFSVEKVQYLVGTMQAGSLPARLKETPISERTIGSSLGEQNLRQSTYAALWGVILVAVLMLVYYLFAGVVANVALLLNIILVLASMAALEARFTLAGIAGVILTIGMVVDANVLIFERMREEKERGSTLRMIIKNGYDKALSTIMDSNITTLLTCIIIYNVGSEEIKGFGLTLGCGIVLSLFTSLYVSRTLFSLLIKYRLLKEVPMLKLVGVPTINWYGMRKVFIPVSVTVIVVGMGALLTRPSRDLLDVEFIGGVSAEFALVEPTQTESEISGPLTEFSEQLKADVDKVAAATVEATETPATYRVTMGDLPAGLVAAIVHEPLEDKNWLARGGISPQTGARAVEVTLQQDIPAKDLEDFVRSVARTRTEGTVEQAADNLAQANLGTVLEAGMTEKGRYWNITTTERNKRLVQYALEQSLGDRLERQPRINFNFRGQDGHAYVITDSRLETVIPTLPGGAGDDITDFQGGAAMWLDELSPPASLPELTSRIKNMRLQPGYQDFPYRDFRVVGVTESDRKDRDGNPLYSSVVVTVVDQSYRYSENPESWISQFAQKERELVTAALGTEQSLRRVSQFKPQIAAQATQRAIIALVLSWAMIIGYLWVRFGRPVYGIAGVVALIHDVLIALSFLGIAGIIGGQGRFGEFLLIDDFKINMTIVAAFLTIIGYSINDSIVIFDRIREMRGRLGIVTPKIINDAINQCLSRTIMTSATTFLVLLIMYVFGGSSIRGFNYCMLIGVITGTYSSIAIASPLLIWGSKVIESKPVPTAPATA